MGNTADRAFAWPFGTIVFVKTREVTHMYHSVLLQTHLRHGSFVVLLKSRTQRSIVGMAIKRTASILYRAKWGKGVQPAHICGCGCEQYTTRSHCSYRYAPHSIYCIASDCRGALTTDIAASTPLRKTNRSRNTVLRA